MMPARYCCEGCGAQFTMDISQDTDDLSCPVCLGPADFADDEFDGEADEDEGEDGDWDEDEGEDDHDGDGIPRQQPHQAS